MSAGGRGHIRLPGRLPVPLDPALPTLATVLDGSQMAAWLGAAQGRPGLQAMPRYLRYKPASRATVLYDIAVNGRRTVAVVTIKAGNVRRELRRPEAALAARRAAKLCLSPEPFQFLEEPRALVEWYPARAGMPGLAFDPGWLRSELASVGREAPYEDPVLVSYKPERRAVQRWGPFYVKTYLDRAEYLRAAEAAQRSSEIPRINAPAYLVRAAQERMLVFPEVDSRPGPVSTAALGAVLARLHAAAAHPAMRPSPVDERLKLARATAAHVATLVPELGRPVESVLARLALRMPDRDQVVVSHGDLHLGQALATARGPVLIDFDHMCLAAPARDLAQLAAHLVQGGRDDLRLGDQALDELVAGYGGRPAGLDWHLAVAILGRAAFPLRELRTDWPERFHQMVADAGRVIDRVTEP